MLAEKIGKYELVERLASGSMGTVYSAHDPFTNRLVAIKVAHPQLAEDTPMRVNFASSSSTKPTPPVYSTIRTS